MASNKVTELLLIECFFIWWTLRLFVHENPCRMMLNYARLHFALWGVFCNNWKTNVIGSKENNNYSSNNHQYNLGSNKKRKDILVGVATTTYCFPFQLCLIGLFSLQIGHLLESSLWSMIVQRYIDLCCLELCNQWPITDQHCLTLSPNPPPPRSQSLVTHFDSGYEISK